MNKTLRFSDSPSDSPPKPLLLSQGPLRHLFLVPSPIYNHAEHLRAEFIVATPGHANGDGEVEDPPSVEGLVANFLAYVARKVENSAGDRSVNRRVLHCFLCQFEADLLHGNDIHAIAATLPGDQGSKVTLIQHYYDALSTAGHVIQCHESNLLRAVKAGEAKVFPIFGGQGNNEFYFSEIREMYTTYRYLLQDFMTFMNQHLKVLSQLPKAKKAHSRGLEPLQWLHNPDEEPDTEYLLAAPLSFPLIGLLQLAQYSLTCRILGTSPGGLRKSFKGLAGHSQGVVSAVAVSQADTWESFFEAAKTALTLLFWIGLRSQQAFPQTAIAPSLIKESINAGEGSPTPMLSVRELPEDVLQQQINDTNHFLPPDKRVGIALFNGANNFVVSGTPTSLCGLNSRLRKMKAIPGLDQARVPFRERKLSFTNAFLPITAPFHSPYLLPASGLITEDVSSIVISKEELMVPVYSTEDGKDLRSIKEANVVPELIRMITFTPLHWKAATTFPNATHILDFGPGSALGIGFLTQKLKDGRGVRIISSTSMDGHGSNTQMGSKEEIFDRNPDHPVKYGPDWLTQHGPRARRNKVGQPYIDTKFSRLLGLPPFMVAGMTPCTVPWDFVAATMNAGYHIELAGGGYYNASCFANAIRKIVGAVAPGRGVTLNLIYVNPSAISWQIPLIRQLRAENIPIEGLTIGAGVPTLEVATEYIRTLGLRHIAFKPGSVESIYKVIEIARSNPDFPVILQWTGGRGGGHHSFEDFHQPLVQTYSKIRDCPNIVLVAGSGFGGAEDTYPYLTGTWASSMDHAPMPFDGILFGSRMMTAKEAHTSRQVKQAIVDAEGIDDSQWEETYKGPAGGVMTVLSEMREPIHKLATRGVRFWAELDKTIFSLDRSKRVAALQDKREYIIKKLNDDFQKVWFGRSKDGEAVEIEEMSYSEVLYRLAELLYIKSQSRWIDDSYKALLADFVRRVEERFAIKSKPSLVQRVSEILDPRTLIAQTIEEYPGCSEQLLSAQDAQYLLALCQRRGQKPVPFIPALDENFEYWFKKDSLWQSEDIDAVVGQDVGRTCILQGPVAVKYSRVVDQPIKDILDGVCAAYLQKMVGITAESNSDLAIEHPVKSSMEEVDFNQRGISVRYSETAITISIQTSQECPSTLPHVDSWFNVLAGGVSTWRQMLFTARTIVQGKNVVDNPIKRLFAPTWDIEVTIECPDEPAKTVVRLRERLGSEHQFSGSIEVRAITEKNIQLEMFEHRNALASPIALRLYFMYCPEFYYAPIQEVMEQRNDRIKDFYWGLWFGEDERPPRDSSLALQFRGGSFTIKEQEVADFVYAVRNTNEAYVTTAGKSNYAPMDFAIKAAWKGMTTPLFLVDGDLTNLIHLSNGFRLLPGAGQLKVGDVLETSSCVNAIQNLPTGKVVEVRSTLTKKGSSIMQITSRFLYRGIYSDYDKTFERKEEIPLVLHLRSVRDIKLLQSREWLHFYDPNIDLRNQTLKFRLESRMQFENKHDFRSIETYGKVLFMSSTGDDLLEIGRIEYCADHSVGNPVMDFLSRHASPIEQPHMFDTAVPLNENTALSFQAPASNEQYAEVSGDFNPIHVSRVFSSYVRLQGTITHGMYSSASVRNLAEVWAAENDVRLMRSFDCTFDDVILPNDHIDVNIWHVGMISGRKIVRVEATRNGTARVLTATAEVEQPASAYIFTGQGSQVQGMGMNLYAQYEVARKIWDRADKFLLEKYGMLLSTCHVCIYQGC